MYFSSLPNHTGDGFLEYFPNKTGLQLQEGKILKKVLELWGRKVIHIGLTQNKVVDEQTKSQ
jgi:spore cortex formation protein SpoVR/YcgB (stage V sporulation)